MSTVGMDLSTIFGNGGIQRYAWELLEHLVRLEERPDLFILTRSKKIDLIRQAVGNSDRVQISGGMPHPLALGDSLRSLTNLYKGLVWKRHLRDVDLVHFHEVSIYTPAAGRHVTTVHDLFPLQEEIPVPDSMRSSWTRLAGQVVRTADRILAPSEYTRSIIGQLFPDDVHRVRVTPLAASDRFVPSELDRPYHEPYFVWIGRLDPR